MLGFRALRVIGKIRLRRRRYFGSLIIISLVGIIVARVGGVYTGFQLVRSLGTLLGDECQPRRLLSSSSVSRSIASSLNESIQTGSLRLITQEIQSLRGRRKLYQLYRRKQRAIRYIASSYSSSILLIANRNLSQQQKRDSRCPTTSLRVERSPFRLTSYTRTRRRAS